MSTPCPGPGRRTVLAGLAATLAMPVLAVRGETRDLAADIGTMLLLGFEGTSYAAPTARLLAAEIAAGRAGGVFFVKGNVGNRADVAGLVRAFTPESDLRPLVAIDHEGGSVQRLGERHGLARLPAAHIVAATLAPDAARDLYAGAARDLRTLGFNLNLAPVVDLHDPDNPAIGHYGRAFAGDPEKVATYAAAFVDGFATAGVACALKHFPGAGFAHEDSHHALPDISATWTRRELDPYRRLIASGHAAVVMSGHMRLAGLEPGLMPVTVSPAVVGRLLRQECGFRGVAMTDDLDMVAVRDTMDRRAAVIAAIAAGNDLLMVRNVTAFDADLTRNVVAWIADAIQAGTLRADSIAASAARVRALRARGAAVSAVPTSP